MLEENAILKSVGTGNDEFNHIGLKDTKFWKGLIGIQKIIMVVAGISTTLIVSMAMIMRAVFDIDFVGYEEILVIVAFWLYMIGSSYGSYENSQITADILNIYLKEGKVKSIANLIKSAVTVVLGLIFNYWAFQLAEWAFVMNVRTPVWRLPAVLGQGSIFVGLTFMSFYNIVYFYEDLRAFIHEMKTGRGGK